MSHRDILESELRTFRIELPADQKRALARYCDELARWGQKMNLTGLSGAAMVRRLVIEPVWVGLQLRMTGILADIGSGNGSPAVPLHIISQLQTTHLIEVRVKRAAFLRHLASVVGKPGLVVHRARFEDMVSGLGAVDWVTLQGVQLDTRLREAIRHVASPAPKIVWITSSLKGALEPTQILEVPKTGSQVLLFRRDQF